MFNYDFEIDSDDIFEFFRESVQQTFDVFFKHFFRNDDVCNKLTCV